MNVASSLVGGTPVPIKLNAEWFLSRFILLLLRVILPRQTLQLCNASQTPHLLLFL